MRTWNAAVAALLLITSLGPTFAQPNLGAGATRPIVATLATAQVDDGRTILGAPAAPVVGPLAAITLAPGAIPGMAVTGSLPVTVTGAGVPTGSLALSCAITSSTPTAFSITGGATQTLVAPATLGAATPIDVRCIRAVVDQSATVTCTQTATPGPNPPNLTAGVTCPGSGGTPNPGSVPAAPGPVAVAGPPSTTASTTLSFTNVAGLVPYQVANCTPSAGFTTSTAFPLSVPVNASSAVNVGCTTPAIAGTSAPSGTLACTTTVVGFNPVFTLTCAATAPAAAAAVPQFGPGGKALLAALLLGIGLFALHRLRWGA